MSSRIRQYLTNRRSSDKKKKKTSPIETTTTEKEQVSQEELGVEVESKLEKEEEDNNNMADESSALLRKEEEGGEEERPTILSWSQSLMASEEHNEITTAAFLLRDAIILSKDTSLFAHTDYLISTNSITKNGSSDNGFSKICRRILTLPIVTRLLTLCVIGMVVISFIEPPAWCRKFENEDGTVGGCEYAMNMQGVPAFYVDDTEDKIQYYYPSTRTDYLDTSQAFKIEVALLLLIILHTLLCIGKDGLSLKKYLMFNLDDGKVDTLTSKNMKNIRMFRMIRLISIILLAGGLLSELFFASVETRPLAVYLRLLMFISYSEGVQRELLIALELIPSLISVAVVLFMVIGFYGLIGVAAFYGTKEGELHFSNWVEGIWTLWTSMTTVIYPDVMMAGYNENRWVALYFITFMMFTFFFLLNVILGVVANGYNASNEARDKETKLTRTNYLIRAFDLITSKTGLDHVTYDQLTAIFLVLNEECDEIPRIPENKAEILFAILDQDGSKELSLVEFMNFTTVMMLEFDEVKSTWLESMIPSLLESQTYIDVRDFITSAKFDFGIDVIVLLNALIVIAQCYPILAGHSDVENPKMNDGMIDTPYEVVETLFTILYVVEMVSKIVLMGWKKYSSSIRNLFDGFVTILAIGATLIVYYPNGYNSSHLIRFVVMSRVVRVFRLFMVIKPFQIMSNTFIGVLPSAGRIALLLFCVVYFFSAVGMDWFGGRITRDPQNSYSAVLENTDFSDNFYWANNFNDMLSGMNCCFNFLVINNWNEMETGIIAISSKYSRWFFFSFFVCGVIIINNLVVAVVIDFFFNELEASTEAYEEKTAVGGLKKLSERGRSLYFDGEKLTGGNTKGRYRMVLSPGLNGQQQKDMMTKLVP